MIKYRLGFLLIIALVITLSIITGCKPDTTSVSRRAIPHEAKWGIYELNLSTQDVRLIYSTPDEIQASALRLNAAGNRFIFAQKAGGPSDDNLEIYSIGIDGNNLTRLTTNSFMDLYPVWSPDGGQIAFLSKRERDLDIYVMDADGTDVKRLFDSGGNDADIDWAGKSIVFTSRFAIWKMNQEGTQPIQISRPPDQGQWGKANLPAGDYDPRLSLDGKKVVFERLEDINQPNGGYNLFIMNADGTGEIRLTNNGYAQGLASWSHSGDKLAYVVAAINGVGKYDIYMINSDGTTNLNITPAHFPADFLCHSPVFSKDDSNVFFIGQWWK